MAACKKSILSLITGLSFPGELFPGSFITANLYDIFAASLFRENITLLSQINQISLHRLKKIQEKKKVLKEKSEKERELRRAAGGEQEPANLLAEEKDEDLLFE